MSIEDPDDPGTIHCDAVGCWHTQSMLYHTAKLFIHRNTKLQYSLSLEPRHEISNNMVCVTSKASDQPAHTHSLIRAFTSRLNIL